MKSLPYFGFIFQQLDKTTYKNYDIINANMEYVVKYYQYKTFGGLPSDIPDIIIEGDQVDYMMIEKFFTDFTIKPTWLTKEDLEKGFENNQLEIMTSDAVEKIDSISPNVGQNILYRIAKEVLWGYSGKNTLDDLKVFYSPKEKEHNGLYYEDGKRHVNNTFRYRNFLAGSDQDICNDEELNDMTKVTLMFEKIRLATWFDDGNYFTNTNKDNARYSLIDTDTGTAQEKINKEYGKLINKVITEELTYRKPENIAKYKADALAYIKVNSDGKYIPLSLDLINNLTKAGITNTAYYYYKRDGSKVVALEAVIGAIPTFMKDKKCGLTDNIETYTVKNIEYASDVKNPIEEIDGLSSKLSALIVADSEDLDVLKDIKKMIATKNTEWIEFKIQLQHMDQKKAKTLLDQKYQSFKTFFENTYMMILHCGSTWSSNDVDSYYDDYLSISNYANGELLKFTKNSGSTQISVVITDFQYTNEFNTAIATYQIPGINKSVSTLLYSTDASEVDAGKQYAHWILKSILESAMLKYDTTGSTITEVSGYGARGVDKKLLNERIAINTKDIKTIPSTNSENTSVPKQESTKNMKK